MKNYEKLWKNFKNYEKLWKIVKKFQKFWKIMKNFKNYEKLKKIKLIKLIKLNFVHPGKVVDNPSPLAEQLRDLRYVSYISSDN